MTVRCTDVINILHTNSDVAALKMSQAAFGSCARTARGLVASYLDLLGCLRLTQCLPCCCSCRAGFRDVLGGGLIPESLMLLL